MIFAGLFVITVGGPQDRLRPGLVSPSVVLSINLSHLAIIGLIRHEETQQGMTGIKGAHRPQENGGEQEPEDHRQRQRLPSQGAGLPQILGNLALARPGFLLHRRGGRRRRRYGFRHLGWGSLGYGRRGRCRLDRGRFAQIADPIDAVAQVRRDFRGMLQHQRENLVARRHFRQKHIRFETNLFQFGRAVLGKRAVEIGGDGVRVVAQSLPVDLRRRQPRTRRGGANPLHQVADKLAFLDLLSKFLSADRIDRNSVQISQQGS